MSAEIPGWARAEKPWDEACKLKVVRHDYKPEGEIIDPGVNFFVLTLEHLGAKPKYSCEGHPNEFWFYVMFHASYELALRIASQGVFRVELSSQHHGPGWWCIRLNHVLDERDKRGRMRKAALAWQKSFWNQTQPAS